MEKKRVAEKLRRERILDDPVKGEVYRQKERERYHERKRLGKIKSIDELTDREKRYWRKYENERKRNYRHRVKELEAQRDSEILFQNNPNEPYFCQKTESESQQKKMLRRKCITKKIKSATEIIFECAEEEII